MPVINLTQKKTPDYAKKLTCADAALNVLRWEMHTWAPKDLAEEVGVSVATIYNIKSGRTKWPRPHTFFALIEALDLEMFLVKK